MFITYADYVRAAMQLLQDKPKGMGYCSGTGVVFLIAGALHYVEEGECIEDANVGDLSEWERHRASMSSVVCAALNWCNGLHLLRCWPMSKALALLMESICLLNVFVFEDFACQLLTLRLFLCLPKSGKHFPRPTAQIC